MPSVPPLCLTLCEHQGAAIGKDASSLDCTKVEKGSTIREATTTTRRTENSCSTATALNNQLLIRGGPPAVVVATTNNKPQTTDLNKQSRCPPGNALLSKCSKSSPPETSPVPNGPMPSVLSASVTQEKPPTPLDAITGNQNDWLYTVAVMLSSQSEATAIVTLKLW